MKIAFFSGFSKSILSFNSELVTKISESGHEIVCIGPEEGYKEQFQSLGANFIQVKFNRHSTNPFDILLRIKKLKKVFRENNFDAYYGFTTVGATVGAISAKLAGIKRIYVAITGAGKVVLPKKGLFNNFLRLALFFLYRMSLKNCEKVFFLNNQNKQFFIKHKIVRTDQVVKVGGSGVNLEKFTPQPLPEKNSFLFVGSLLKLKGIMEYMQAAYLVKKKHPEAEFHIVGEIDERLSAISKEELDKYVDNGTVVYHGYQNDVRPYYVKCRCFVLPSYTEGIPTCVIEAMATKRPIITTFAPGCSETIIDNKEGFLVPVADVISLAEKMNYMIEHPGETEKMAEASLIRVKQEFDVNKVNEVMMKAMQLM